MQAAQNTSIYAAILGLMFFAITLRVALLRMKSGQSLGAGNDQQFEKIMRGHGNFVETVPMCLILMLLLEQQGAASLTMHVLGIALLLGRLFHYLQLTEVIKPLLFRIAGMVLTLGTAMAASVRLLIGF